MVQYGPADSNTPSSSITENMGTSILTLSIGGTPPYYEDTFYVVSGKLTGYVGADPSAALPLPGQTIRIRWGGAAYNIDVNVTTDTGGNYTYNFKANQAGTSTLRVDWAGGIGLPP